MSFTIVIASDKIQDKLEIEERLHSILKWGITAELLSPDLETRIAFLKNKAKENDFIISDDIITFLASKINSNFRELEGTFFRIMAFIKFTERLLTLDSIKEACEILNIKGEK